MEIIMTNLRKSIMSGSLDLAYMYQGIGLGFLHKYLEYKYHMPETRHCDVCGLDYYVDEPCPEH